MVTRKHVKRDFYIPSCPTKETFVKKVTKRRVQKSILKRETYVKDSRHFKCPDKHIINDFLASTVKNDESVCLVLDGNAARSTKALLKTGKVARVDIPNFSESFETISKIKNNKVHAHPVALYDFVTSTCTTYDVMYLDTCGYFSTSQSDDLKRSMELIIKKRLLKTGGVIGLTVCNRGDQGQWKECETFMNRNGFDMVFDKQYGSMRTFFYVEGHFIIVGKNDIWCDVCTNKLKAYAMSFHRQQHDMCCSCYNKSFDNI